MKGFQITFFTLQDRHRHGRPMHEWLIETAETLGIRGRTVVMAAEGDDRKGRTEVEFRTVGAPQAEAPA